MKRRRRFIFQRIRDFKEKLYADGQKRALEIELIKKEVNNKIKQ